MADTDRHSAAATLALDDLRIIELPCFDPMPYFAAAMAGKTLADFGAEVIKIEPLGAGAQERHRGPFPGQKGRNLAARSRGLNDHPDTIARACEEILLFSGLADTACERCALAANRSESYLSRDCAETS